MKYENRETAKARSNYIRALIELYLNSDSFEKFKTDAAQLHGYTCHFFDPFWRAYWSRRYPFAYQCLLGSIIAAFCLTVCLTVHLLTGFYLIYALVPVIALVSAIVFNFIGSDIMDVIDCYD